jgi:hypothetical protein
VRAGAGDRIPCPVMADPRRVELEDLIIRPGTYFNPQTEVLVVVDDAPELDAEIFNFEEFEGADWVIISDEVPVDEHRRDELLEKFQITYHAGNAEDNEDDEEEDAFDEDEQEPGRED